MKEGSLKNCYRSFNQSNDPDYHSSVAVNNRKRSINCPRPPSDLYCCNLVHVGKH